MSKIIIALDFAEPVHALDFAKQIQNKNVWVKVGLELFIKGGQHIVSSLREMGFSVFLDLKFLDIPNTVAGAVRSCSAFDVDMITLHISGGRQMIEAAIDARNSCSALDKAPRLIGVTLLTSMDTRDMPFVENINAGQIARKLALDAYAWGLDGCVCSGLEAADIRESTATDFKIVTPGIRLQSMGDDQKRTVTPNEAVKAGSDFLVIGRPVTRSSDPLLALQKIISSIQSSNN
ncbi:orotidine-5'-phosphate decarboxylase [Desulfonatronovibrio magnus]|uniref:orotidine-5'-phosphate decarboxylase n=1 Tax=Desulfonatronovibrio magnus TaxID=698827 RepID=UPI0005EB02EE|nr:orotidine-5'-phosphate decarboxylase [Desulfonatronovibrio magnus]RQD62538.1 MAG: orotidine-5'-phosphate decarboxylase [Desulfonatronovibrio sp. MSAO_Bac4]